MTSTVHPSVPTPFPPFTLRLPEADAIPLICDSPHSGVSYPDDFRHGCEPGMLRMAEDTHVEKLYGFAPAMGLAASLFALFTGGLSAGAPQAAKQTAAMAVHGNCLRIFMILSPHCSAFSDDSVTQRDPFANRDRRALGHRAPARQHRPCSGPGEDGARCVRTCTRSHPDCRGGSRSGGRRTRTRPGPRSGTGGTVPSTFTAYVSTGSRYDSRTSD